VWNLNGRMEKGRVKHAKLKEKREGKNSDQKKPSLRQGGGGVRLHDRTEKRSEAINLQKRAAGGLIRFVQGKEGCL